MNNYQESHRKSLICKDRLDLMVDSEQGPYRINADRSATVSIDFFQWRRRQIKTYYQIAANFDLQGKTVETAVWMIDRVALQATTAILNDDRSYQQTAMAVLLAAIKTHEPERFVSPLVRELSKGFKSEEELEGLEIEILVSLEFQTSPPTPSAYAESLVGLVPNPMFIMPGSTNINVSAKEAVLGLVAGQIREAVGEPLYIAYGPWRVALAALLNATKSALPQNRFKYIQHLFVNGLGAQMTANDWFHIEQVQERLSMLLENSVLGEDIVQHETGVPKTHDELDEQQQRKVPPPKYYQDDGEKRFVLASGDVEFDDYSSYGGDGIPSTIFCYQKYHPQSTRSL